MATDREKYWDKTGGTGPWDVIVIGSGIGGMTTAAMLAKWGNKVLVLEQHYTAGGFTHTFKRKQWTWDVGVHAVGEVDDRAFPGRVLKELTDGRLKWTSLGPVYDEFHFPDDFALDFPSNKVQFRQNLIDAFPNEVEAIDKYFDLVKQVGRSMRGYYLAKIAPPGLRRVTAALMARDAQKWLQKRTADVLAELTDDPKLRTILAAQWGYYGSIPSRSSFAMQALVTKHFWHGGFYPVGGSKRIAVELLRTVAEAGGWTRIYADVEQIIIEDGAAVGVRMKDGKEIRAKRIVSAAGVLSTVKRLLPAHALGPWADEVKELQPASAHVVLYMGFEGDIASAGATPANKWFWSTWDTEDDVWEVGGDEIGDAGVLYCSFSSLKDPLHEAGPKQIHTGEVITFVPWDTFSKFADSKWKKRGPEYDALKARIQESLKEQFLKHMPELRPMLKYVELSTPVTTRHFVRPVNGSIYGIEPTTERFLADGLRPRSPIPNLFFSGSDVATVGVIGAMMGGVLAATAMEPMKGINWLRGV